MRISLRRALVFAALSAVMALAWQDYRLRVTVNMVELDATVVDDHGGYSVPYLKASDFRILVDGQPQEIKNCSFVRTNDVPPPPPVAADPPADPLSAPAGQPAMPSAPLQRDRVNRTIVLFVGDLLTSSESIPAIRAGLTKFVLEQVRPGDLVAIVRSSAGLGALQDFTSDKGMLLAAVDQVPLTANAAGAEMTADRAAIETTATVLQLLRRLAGLPGRKSVVLISDSLRLATPEELNPVNGQTDPGAGMHRLVDESLRAGVVLYGIDTRGTSWSDSQALTAQTGGFTIAESSRIDAALERVMADQRGYYVLQFQPSADVMQPKIAGPPDFHKLKVEALHPGLTVRSHGGFFGIGDEYRNSTPTMAAILSKAMESPLPLSDIHLDSEASFLTGKNSYFMRVTVYIDGRDVEFNGPPAHMTGGVHLLVRAFNANGESSPGGIDDDRQIDVDDSSYRRTLNYGLVYTTLLTVPKPGPYRVRIVCRDDATGKIGASSDFVDIPSTKASGVRLSGIVFQHDLGIDDQVAPASVPGVYSAGQTAGFSFQISWNGARPNMDRLEIRTRLYRDGVEVWHSMSAPIAADAANFARGSLQVPAGLNPGNYLLRVDIEDRYTPYTPTAWQWAKLRVR
jgi:VWFA-related protein